MSFEEWINVNEAYTICFFLVACLIGFIVAGGLELVRLFFAFVLVKTTALEKTIKKRNQGACIQEDQKE